MLHILGVKSSSSTTANYFKGKLFHNSELEIQTQKLLPNMLSFIKGTKVWSNH